MERDTDRMEPSRYLAGGSGIAKRTREGTRKREQMPIPECHPNLLWKGEDASVRKAFSAILLKIGGWVIHSPRIMNWNDMKELGCDEFLEDMFLIRILWNGRILTSNMWMKALSIREPIYKEWCLEFLCSMRMKEKITDIGVTTDKFLEFRLGGQKHEVTLFEFGNLLGLYSDEDLSNRDFKFLVMSGERNKNNFDANGYWERISTESKLVFGESEVSTIKKPMLRVLHRIIVQSLLHRTSGVELIYEDDLWVLHALDEKHPYRHLNVAWVIVQHLHKHAADGTRNYICAGHFISRIARNLGLFNEKEMSDFGEPVVPWSIDIKKFTNLRESRNGKLRGLPEVLDIQPITTWDGL